MEKIIVRITYKFRGLRGHIYCLLGNAEMIASHLFKDGAIDIRINRMRRLRWK